MLGIAREAGHELTNDASSADVLVVNTCAFIDQAKQESIERSLNGAAQEDGNCTRLVVTGCSGGAYRERASSGDPESTRFSAQAKSITSSVHLERPRQWQAGVGGRDAPDLSRGSSRVSSVLDPVAPELRPPLRRRDTAAADDPKHLAYVKVAEGCDYTCAFCIIPTLRGKFRSRDAHSIVKKRVLAARGRERAAADLQDTTFYGSTVARAEPGRG